MLDKQNDLLHAQTKEMIHFFFALDYNQGRPPEQRIPLRLYVEDQARIPGLTPQQREDKVRQDLHLHDHPTLPRHK